MAKSLLLNVLCDVLGNYVEGLTKDNLKVGVWSGKIELSNLQLKASALDQLNLPIRVVRGSLNNLKVKVPWTSLESKPVEVFIDGVYLLAAPLDFSRLAAEEARKMILASNAAKLKQMEDAVLLAIRSHETGAETTAQKASYIQQLTTRILDNLEVTISNLHIRYEDSYADQNSAFSCGVTLEQVVLTTTDETWNTRFVKREAAAKAATAVHKQGIVQNCAVYWNVNSPTFEDVEQAVWKRFMNDTIFRGKDSSKNGFNYILQPPNDLRVKIVHRDVCNETTPNIDVKIESSIISFNASDQQYKQAMMLVKSFGELDRKKQVSSHRPRNRPTVDPRGWWHYAYRLVVGADRSFAAKVQLMTLCARTRPKYVALVRQKIVNGELHQQDTTPYEEQLRGFDEALPLASLLVFREVGAKEAVLEIQRARQKLLNKQKLTAGAKPQASGGMFTGWFSSKPKPTVQSVAVTEQKLSDEEEDSKLMNDLESKFNDLSKQAESAINQAFSFRARFISSSTLSLLSSEKVFALLNMAADFQVETRFSTVLLKFSMNQLALRDCCSSNPYNPDILTFVHNNAVVPAGNSPPSARSLAPCSVVVTMKPEVMDVNIAARPALITWNDECIHKLFMFVAEGVGNDVALSTNTVMRSSLASFAAENALPKSAMKILIDVEAPKIIFPEMKGSAQCVVVDMGHLMVKGGMSVEGMSWDVQLNEINIAMPLEGPNDAQIIRHYLLKPFQIRVDVQNVHKEEADMTINIRINPFVQADLDAMKIARLMRVMFVVLATISNDNDKQSGAAGQSAAKVSGIDNAPNLQHKRRAAMVVKSAPIPTKDESSTRTALKLEVSLSKIILSLAIDESHSAALTFETLSAVVTQRQHDTEVSFLLNALVLEDSMRPKLFAAVLWAHADEKSQQTDLIKGSYVTISSVLSPRYEGFQSDAFISIASIHVFVDHVSTATYRALAENLVDAFQVMAVKDAMELSRKQSYASSLKPKMMDEITASLGGSRVQVSLEQMAVHLLAFDPQTKGIRNQLEYFERAHSLNVCDLSVACIMKGEMKVDVSLRTVEVVDERRKTEAHCYRKMIGGDFHRIASTHTPDAQQESMIIVQLKEEANSCMHIQVDINRVTLQLSAEVIMHLVEVLLANVRSFLNIFEVISSSSKASSDVGGCEKVIATQQSVSDTSAVAGGSSVIISFSMLEPQLMMLENPKDEHSKALVNRSKVYVQLMLGKTGDEDKMIVHVSLIESEVFVVHDVVGFKRFHRLLQPMSLELRLTTSTVQNQTVSLEVGIGIEDVAFRASLNDLVLLSDVLKGQQLEMIDDDVVTTEDSAKNNGVYSSAPAESVTVYKISSNIAGFELVLINDYHGQNVPFLRIQAKDASFSAEGVTKQLGGSGTVSIAVDYFNLPMSIWEPVVEEWRPTLRVIHDFNGLQLEASYGSTLQVNVTGELIKCLVNAGQLMQNVGLNDAVAVGESRPSLSINNQLGIPVEVLDSSGLSLLVALDYNTALPLNLQMTKKSSSSGEAKTLSLRFRGELGEQFADLKHLPHGLRRSKVYQLQPQRHVGSEASVQAVPPVSEEVVQHSRYNPATSSWESPWVKLSDPPEWTDITGKPAREPRAIQPPHHWRWVEPEWKVVLSGVVGKEIDADGWEYAVNFNSFTATSKRRSKQAADCVRRRRWTRTRVYDASCKQKGSSVLAAAFIVWDVVLHNDETKELRIMTTKQVTNHLPFDVTIGIEEDGYVMETFEVKKGITASVPLQHTVETCILRVRPTESACDWSDPLSLTFVHALKETKTTSRNVLCRDNGGPAVNMIWYVCESRFLHATLVPPLEFCNRLPCAMNLAIQPVNQSTKAEAFDIPSGSDAHALGTTFSGDVQICLTVGHHRSIFSLGSSVPSGDFKDIKVALQNTINNQGKPLMLSIRVSKSAFGSIQLILFSECLLVDKRFLEVQKSNNISLFPQYWTEQGSGLSMITTGDTTIKLLSNDTKSNLEAIDLNSLTQAKSSVELSDAANRKHHLTMKLERFSIAADMCQVLTVMHSFHIVNCMSKSITLRQKAQKSSNADVIIPARSCEPWCPLAESGDTNLRLCCDGASFSMGCIDINAIGTCVLMLPAEDGSQDFVAVNVEVRFSQNDEPSYITVTIWDAKILKDPRTGLLHASAAVNLLLRNDTPFLVAVRQHGLEECRDRDRYFAVVQAGERKPFGWADQDIGTRVDIFVDDFRSPSAKPVVCIDAFCVGTDKTFYAKGSPWKVRIKAYSSGTMICLESLSGKESIQTQPRNKAVDARSRDITLKVSAHAIGLSLIAERPNRRELFAAHLMDMQFSLYQLIPSIDETATTILEFHVANVQVDNYSESVVYPVLLHRSHRSLKKAASEKKKESAMAASPTASGKSSIEGGESDFIQFSLVLEQPSDQSTSIVKYVAFRVLEAQVQLDSASILIYLCDMHKDLVEVHTTLQSGEYSLELQAQNFNNTLAVPSMESSLYNCDRQYKLAHGNKIFYEYIVIHPMKVSASFYPTHFPRELSEMPAGMKWMTMVESVSAVEEMDLKVKSFIARNALESSDKLAIRIVNKIARDMQTNLLGLAGNLIGSLSLLGKPAGLYKNIGGGVQDFFYEPITGAMESPLSFVKGMSKGTGSLVSGVAGGVVTSTANIVGSATGSVNSLARGVASLTGDDKYLKERDEKKRELKSSRGGMLSGFKAGGESVVSGFSSGLAGLVTKPLEEGKKTGALGFIKGMGQGLVGVAVKPVMGVTEGISNVAMGINNQFNNVIESSQVRPARALLRRDAEDVDLVLCSLDLFAAKAQAFVQQRTLRKNYKDSFFAAVTLGYSAKDANEKNTFGLALSEKFLIVMNKECELLWMFAVPTLSHFALVVSNEGKYCLDIFEYEQVSAPGLKRIFCANERAALAVYRCLYRFRSVFGNPSAILPLEEVKQKILGLQANPSLGDSDSSNTSRTSSPAPSGTSVNAVGSASSGSTVQYSFGLANATKPLSERLGDQQLLAKAKDRLLRVPCQLPVTSAQDKFVYHKALDHVVWALISDWLSNHDSIISSSRCCTCLVLNHSNTPVQVKEVELVEGVTVVTLGVNGGYDTNSKVIFPGGGAAVFFAFGGRPSLISKEHVKMKIRTTAFSSMLATRESRSDCTAQAGFSPAFLEKTRTDWWAKFVISIN